MSAPRQTVLVEFSYLGDYFYGLQPQPGFRTVGQSLRELLEGAAGARAQGLCFSARTDSGVSAEQNFASAWFRDVPDLMAKLLPLAQHRCSPLAIHGIWSVPRSMNARSCARSKHYQYRITHDKTAARAWHIVPSLHLDNMRRAADLLRGTHDFSALRHPNCSANNPVKHLTRVDVSRVGFELRIDVEGDAFLRQMMRILSGTLAEVGAGLRPWSDVHRILQSRDRKQAGLTAPATGLTLRRVNLLWPGQRHTGLPLLSLRPAGVQP